MTAYARVVLWVTFLFVGVLTYALRASFLSFPDRLGTAQNPSPALRFVPPAILAALAAPALVPDGSFPTVLIDEHVLAGGLAAAVAWRTENVLATLGVGMGALWLLGVVLT